MNYHRFIKRSTGIGFFIAIVLLAYAFNPVSVTASVIIECEDPGALNFGEPEMCVFDDSSSEDLCEEPEAINFGDPLPCEFTPVEVCENPDALNEGALGECLYPDLSGMITIEKNVLDFEGSHSVDFSINFNNDSYGDFTLDTGSASSETFFDLEPGIYTITEGDLGEGWVLDDINCTRNDGEDFINWGTEGSDLTINLGDSEDVTCVFTNEYTPHASLTIIKEIKNEGFYPVWSFDFSIDPTEEEEGDFILSNGESSEISFPSLSPNYSYTVTEAELDVDWVLDDISCAYDDKEEFEGWEIDGQSLIVDLEDGDEVTCVFTNEYLPKGNITIEKIISGDSAPDAWSFDFTNDIGELSNEFSLSNSASFVTYEDVSFGQYTFDEVSLPQDWTLDNVSCERVAKLQMEELEGDEFWSAEDSVLSVVVSDGYDITCTFVNTYSRRSSSGGTRISKAVTINKKTATRALVSRLKPL